jgi:glutamyl/glutaminyl-tRNA synthetase
MVSQLIKNPSPTIRKVPSYLIAEVIDGKPYYYKDYKQVLNKKKTLEDIMGSSTLQGFIVTYLTRLLMTLSEDEFHIFLNETGIHIDTNTNLSGDILVFDASKPLTINTHYANQAPLINIEIDVNIALEQEDEKDYIFKKTQKLLDFGVEKVIWILTKSQKVIVATPNENWLIISWDKNIEILRGLHFNVPAYLEKKGVL